MDPKEGGVPVRLTRQGSGFAASGPGFYVWDEDPASLVRRACELAEASPARQAAAPELAWRDQAPD